VPLAAISLNFEDERGIALNSLQSLIAASILIACSSAGLGRASSATADERHMDRPTQRSNAPITSEPPAMTQIKPEML
jgi:hypothetical protein